LRYEPNDSDNECGKHNENQRLSCPRFLGGLMMTRPNLHLLTIILLVLGGSTAWAQTSREATATAYIDRGNGWMAKGELNRAIADFDLAVASAPAYAVAYYNRGVARHLNGDPDGAPADYNRALQLDPRLAPAYVDRSGIRYVRADLNGVISDNSKAFELDPRLAQAWNNRGLARRDKGDLNGALSDFDRSLKLNPKSAEVPPAVRRGGDRIAIITRSPWTTAHGSSKGARRLHITWALL
jgi:tetratricopeptide (TPR) repeat protein